MSRHPSRRLERVVTPHLFATIAGLLGTIGTGVSQSQLGVTPGFSSRRIWEATSGASAIRGFALVPDALGPGRDSLFVGIADRVERYDQLAQPPVATYMLPGSGPLETIDWLPPTQPGSNGTIVFTRFLPSTLFAIEVDAFGGPTPPTIQPMPNNTFDIASSRDGRWLVAAANPNWPSPGATAGIWLVDPTGTDGAREIITIDGPSGPLGFLANGDLAFTVQSRAVPAPSGFDRTCPVPGRGSRLGIGARSSSGDTERCVAPPNRPRRRLRGHRRRPRRDVRHGPSQQDPGPILRRPPSRATSRLGKRPRVPIASTMD